jgi:hypothetical protein
MSKKAKTHDDEDFLKPRNAEEEKWHQLMDRHDRVGIRYLEAAQLRRKRRLTKAERKFLADFEADRKRVLRDPESISKKCLQTVRRELLLVETLIHEKSLQNIREDEDAALDHAVDCLSTLARTLRDDLIRYAEDGYPFACHAIFRDGKVLANAFTRIAIAYPEHLRKYAEQSLTMPSLRARNPAFTCDAGAIIAAIHLAEGHHASNIHDNRSRIGALCHQFIAEIVDLMEGARLEASERGRTNSKWLNFPALKGNAKAWWKLEMKKWVHLEFAKMKKNPRRNPALWQELNEVTDGGTDSARRAAFEKYCFNKLEQIAGKPSLAASIR